MSLTDTIAKKEAARAPKAVNGKVAGPDNLEGAHNKYVSKVLAEECRVVREAPEGTRNDTLNRAAFNLGTLVPKYLDERTAERELASAAADAGLGDTEIGKTIASGLESGKKNPREIPDPRTNGTTSNNVRQEPPPDDFGPVEYDDAPDAENVRNSAHDVSPPQTVDVAIEWHDARSIFGPLPPTNWIVHDLQICPGRPTLWCGYGYVGKSITAQTIALAMAGGVPVFGKFDIRQGTVRHFDHEQGKHATFKRYQRGAIGMDLEPAELDGRLFVTVFPPVYLNLPNAVDVYSKLCDGTDFVIIDALRGATPGEDENDSKIRVCLDNLGRVSEKTGTTFLVIHHAGKPNDGHSDQRMKVRGSSGIFDACGPVFILSGSKESPHKLVSQQKAPAEAEGGAVDDFYLSVEDVPVGINPRAGIRVTYRSKEDAFGASSDVAKTAEHDDKVVTLIRDNPGIGKNQLRTLARPLRNPDVDDAINRLELAKKIETKPGPNRSTQHFPKEVT